MKLDPRRRAARSSAASRASLASRSRRRRSTSATLANKQMAREIALRLRRSASIRPRLHAVLGRRRRTAACLQDGRARRHSKQASRFRSARCSARSAAARPTCSIVYQRTHSRPRAADESTSHGAAESRRPGRARHARRRLCADRPLPSRRDRHRCAAAPTRLRLNGEAGTGQPSELGRRSTARSIDARAAASPEPRSRIGRHAAACRTGARCRRAANGSRDVVGARRRRRRPGVRSRHAQPGRHDRRPGHRRRARHRLRRRSRLDARRSTPTAFLHQGREERRP